MVQLTIIVTLTLIGAFISHFTGNLIPASIVSMVLMAILLLTNIIKESAIAQSGDFLLSHMTLFFIPPCVAIIDEFSLLEGHIMPFVIICVVSTLLTFTTTALAVRFVIRLQKRHAHHG